MRYCFGSNFHEANIFVDPEGLATISLYNITILHMCKYTIHQILIYTF